MSTLLLRLAGPMQSWGTQSRFSVRDTGLEPSKSGVIGLLCAALGRPRSEPLNDLVGLRMGVRVDREGRLERDYQTAGGTRRKDDRAYGVPTADGSQRRAVTSARYYLADAEFLVGLEAANDEILARLGDAVARPCWPLFLGRKAFVPGDPITAEVLKAPLETALRAHPWRPRSPRERQSALEAEARGEPLHLRLVIDAPDKASADVRHDVPLSFARREFGIRYVTIDRAPLMAGLIGEVP